MAKEWQQQAAVPSSKTIGVFENESEDAHEHLRVLFHTLNRKTLRSLLLGTLPYDLYDEDSPKCENMYNRDGPGTYLIGISIEDRRGAFLSGNEVKEVINHIRDYKAGCEAWVPLEDAYGDSQVSHAQALSLEKAYAIDNTMLSEDDQWEKGDEYIKPRYMTGKGKKTIQNIEEMIAMLGKRLDARFSGEIHQKSRPPYVGCGHRVPTRLLQRDPNYSSMGSSSNVLKLLISCIRRIGLKPIVHTIPMIMVWEEFQIPLAEMLVTVLGQSLISINGLNVAQPGTSQGSGDRNEDLYFKTKRHVWINRPWFMENIQKSLGFKLNRDLYIDAFDTINEKYMDEAQMTKYMKDNDELEGHVEYLKIQINQILDERKAEQETEKETIAKIDRFLDSSTGMFPDLPEDEGDDGDEGETNDIVD
ncbi:hypothetical protein K445DRAFT_15337 [Daldinia sp. EC12]|nr:hypothetical protein K445DRAFT_15337 [Daldinia sp. EC12]